MLNDVSRDKIFDYWYNIDWTKTDITASKSKL